MKVIVCLDDQNGMLFHQRRQSRDSILCQNAVQTFGKDGLWMNAYSAKLFADSVDNITICENVTLDIPGYWFVENVDLLPYIDEITQLVVYRWNRTYPADLYFPMDALRKRLKLTHSRTFEGSSHPMITEEIYDL